MSNVSMVWTSEHGPQPVVKPMTDVPVGTVFSGVPNTNNQKFRGVFYRAKHYIVELGHPQYDVNEDPRAWALVPLHGHTNANWPTWYFYDYKEIPTEIRLSTRGG